MENVYVVLIVAVASVLAIVAVVWILRDRITSGKFTAKRDGVSAEMSAAKPKRQRRASKTDIAPTPTSQPSVDVSGNVILGSGVIRVLRNSVRVTKNWLTGKARIDVAHKEGKK